MKTAVVNFKTTPEVKKGAQNTLRTFGITLSAFLNHRLHQIANGDTSMDYSKKKFQQDIHEIIKKQKRNIADR